VSRVIGAPAYGAGRCRLQVTKASRQPEKAPDRNTGPDLRPLARPRVLRLCSGPCGFGARFGTCASHRGAAPRDTTAALPAPAPAMCGHHPAAARAAHQVRARERLVPRCRSASVRNSCCYRPDPFAPILADTRRRPAAPHRRRPGCGYQRACRRQHGPITLSMRTHGTVPREWGGPGRDNPHLLLH
jgi:hypothetical protein